MYEKNYVLKVFMLHVKETTRGIYTASSYISAFLSHLNLIKGRYQLRRQNQVRNRLSVY